MNDPGVMLVAAALLLAGTHGAEAAQRSAPTLRRNSTAPHPRGSANQASL
jgi:hypothetical protein